MDCRRVHRHRREQNIVCFRHRTANVVANDLTYGELFEVAACHVRLLPLEMLL